jgi:hypothetical protein
VPPASVLVASDELADQDRALLGSWAARGTTVVVADPRSPLLRTVGVRVQDEAFLHPVLSRRCPVSALAGVERVEASGARFHVPAGATACFTDADGAWMVVVPWGRGNVVALGDAAVLTNARLGRADHAELAVSLLAPLRGPSPALVLRPGGPGRGRARLLDMVPAKVKLAALQLGVSFAVVCLWRARRLGRPVPEQPPVQVPGSELVVAVGNLLQRGRARDQAARMIAADLRQTLLRRLGLPADATDQVLAEAAAAAGGGDAAAVLGALAPGPLPDEAALLRFAQEAERVRGELVGA